MIKEIGFKLIALAVFLRILVSIFLFHPDIKTINFQVSFLKQGVVNIYPYLIENKATLPLKEEFVYFPLTYFSLGSYNSLVSSLLGESFKTWLFNADSNLVVSDSNLYLYQFAMKFPLLVVDLLIGYLIYLYFKGTGKEKDSIILWLFNPFTIILIYAYSNIDIYAVLLTLVSLLLFKNKKMLFSAIVLGLAISFKLYPLLFVPFFVLSVKELKEKIMFLVLPVLTFILTIVPFISKAFVNSALLSGLSTRILTPNFTIGSGESVIIAIVVISALFFFGLSKNINLNIVKYLVIVLFTVFSFAHYHISWLLWLTPLLLILYIENKNLRVLISLWLMVAISIPLLYSDRSMTISLFRTYSLWFDQLPTPFVVLQKVYDPFALMSILHSVLIGLSLTLSALLVKTNKDENN